MNLIKLRIQKSERTVWGPSGWTVTKGPGPTSSIGHEREVGMGLVDQQE